MLQKTVRAALDMVARLQKVKPEDLTENSVLLGSPQRIIDTLKKVEAAGIGAWNYEPYSDHIDWSDDILALFGWDQGDIDTPERAAAVLLHTGADAVFLDSVSVPNQLLATSGASPSSLTVGTSGQRLLRFLPYGQVERISNSPVPWQATARKKAHGRGFATTVWRLNCRVDHAGKLR